MRKVSLLFIFLMALLVTTTTFALSGEPSPDLSDANDYYASPWSDEMVFSTENEGCVQWTYTASSTYGGPYTIGFAQDTPTISVELYMFFGAWIDDIDDGDAYDPNVVYYTNFSDTTRKLQLEMIEIANSPDLTEPNYITTCTSNPSFDIETFMDDYAIFYSTTKPTLIKNMIRYYEAIASSDAYDEGVADTIALAGGDYADGFYDGEQSVLIRYYTYGEEQYEQGQSDLFYNGSEFYDLVLSNSKDYQDGFSVGISTNVNAGASAFMVGFEKWIVPAILIVILLGGFVTVANRKNRGE